MSLNEFESFIAYIDDNISPLKCVVRVKVGHEMIIFVIPFNVWRYHWSAARNWKLDWRIKLTHIHINTALEKSNQEEKLNF